MVDRWEACCCSRLYCDLNFQIRLICWKWDWPVAFSWGRLRSRSHVRFHVILEPLASEGYRLRSSQCRQLSGIWATCHPVRTHRHTPTPHLHKSKTHECRRIWYTYEHPCHLQLYFIEAFRRYSSPYRPPSQSFHNTCIPLFNRGENSSIVEQGFGMAQLCCWICFHFNHSKEPGRTAYRFRLDLQSSQGKRKDSFMCYCN